jgi:hypothetical protein
MTDDEFTALRRAVGKQSTEPVKMTHLSDRDRGGPAPSTRTSSLPNAPPWDGAGGGRFTTPGSGINGINMLAQCDW